jgi:hypothetical protein
MTLPPDAAEALRWLGMLLAALALGALDVLVACGTPRNA